MFSTSNHPPFLLSQEKVSGEHSLACHSSVLLSLVNVVRNTHSQLNSVAR